MLLAALFIGTAVVGGVWAVWQSRQDAKNNEVAQQNSITSQTNQADQNKPKLAGTKLAGFTPVAKVSSLEETDTTVGTGKEAKANSTVTVQYTGALASTGVIFESSLDSGQPATFGLNQVIKGWTEGVPGMKVGGTRRLVIPAALAYGSQGNAKIPANSDLVFDITLLDVK